ncbi:unnamed protein product, partial [marine sediment metagenome]
LRNDRYEQVFLGPNGRFAVRIGDADVPWPRVTLTDRATGKKEIILEKNDAALDVLHAIKIVLCAPLSPFLPKI